MPFSPELKVLPGIALKFFKSGVAKEIISSLNNGDENRSLIEDARRVVAEFKKSKTINIYGLENIKSGSVIFFNHPNIDILFPGLLDMMVNIHDRLGRDSRLLMSTEISLFAQLNDKQEIPGSIQFMERFHRMYGGAIISTPTVKSRKDYTMGRMIALRKIMRELEAGNIISISPEGHIERDGIISPIETFHWGSGAISRMAARHGIPTIPVGIWGSSGGKAIFVNIGTEFFPDGNYKGENQDREAVIDIMSRVAGMLPPNLRGPFDGKEK